MKGRAKGAAAVLMLAVILALFSGGAVQATGSGIENEVSEENEGRFGTTSPWLSGTEDDIYENPVDAGEEEQDISVSSPGWVERNIAELFRNMSSSLISLLQDNMGASIDSIVYGRVGSGHPDSVNIYAFELRKGNPYGVTGAVCYSLLRGMMFIFLGVHFAFQLAKAAWSGQTAKSREEIKGQIPMLLAKFCAMVLMPYLLDAAIYVRDVLLYGIKEVTGQMVTGGATLSLSKAFLINAERSGTFVDAVMYLGTVVLTIYFVFLYVAVAIDMLVCFVSFPFICVLHGPKRDLIGSWTATVFSNLMTPVVDAVLLLVPLLTSMMLSDVIRGVAVIQLVMCMLIIPARVRFKALLGIQSNDKHGFMGAMAVMTLTRAVAAGVKRGAGRIADAVSDARKSRIHGELAEADREEEAALLSGDAGNRESDMPVHDESDGSGAGLRNENSKGDDIGISEELPEGMENQGLQPEESENGIPGEPAFYAKDDEDIFDAGQADNEHADGSISGAEGSAMTDTVETEGGGPGEAGTVAAVTEAEYGAAGKERDTRIDALREADRKVEQAQDAVDGLRMERAETVIKDRQLKRKMLDCQRGSEEYRNLEKERAEVESRTAVLDKKIAQKSGELNRLRRKSGEMHSAFGMKNTPTGFDERRAEILRKRANISNFEQPEFKGILSNERMRVLYRNRAIAGGIKAVVGTAGAAAGSAVGGSSALFLGGSAVAMAAAGGISAGSGAGETAVDASVGAGRMARAAAGTIGRNAYRAAEMAASSYLMGKMIPEAVKVRIPADGGAGTGIVQVENMEAEGSVASGIVHPSVETAYPETETQDIRVVVPNANEKAENIGMDRKVQRRIAADVGTVVGRAVSSEGDIVSGSIMHVLQQANLRFEREMAVIREEGTAEVAEETVRKRRVEIRTEMLSEAIMANMEQRGYLKGTEEYADAEKLVWEKVRKLFEESEEPLI